MKAVITLVLFAFVFAPFSSSQHTWFRDGKLKDADVALWRNATEGQKLATCANWISEWERRRMTKTTYRTFAALRQAAENLRYSIDDRLLDVRADRPVYPYASACARDLGILKF